MKIIFSVFFASLYTALVYLKKKEISFIQVCRIFKVRFFYVFIFIRLFQKEKKNYQIKIPDKDLIDFKGSLSNKIIIEDLKKNGFFSDIKLNLNFYEKLNKSILKSKKFFSIKQKKSNTDCAQFERISNLTELILFSRAKNIPHLTIKFEKNDEGIVNKLGRNWFFLDLAKNYLNSNQISYASSLYISNPGKISDKEKSSYAQEYHFDCEYSKLLKIFVYLTDVNFNSGPHVYVPKTNTIRIFKHSIPQRMADDEVEKYYGGVKKFISPKRTILIEDTFGLHKGENPISESRAMLIFVYGKNIIHYDKSCTTLQL
jgi:hypothetical protein